MTKFTPSSSQLNDTLDHIYYEIAQMIGTLRSTNDVTLNYALVESRLIHVRALLYFFEKPNRAERKGKELDDVLSLDYEFPAKDVGINEFYTNRLNKDLAHLTYSRSERTPTEKRWPNNQVVWPILECCDQFCQHLIVNYLPVNCPKKQASWKRLLDKIRSIQKT
jgi:hypothetical protein